MRRGLPLFRYLTFLMVLSGSLIISANTSLGCDYLILTADPTTIPGDGLSTSTITATAKRLDGSPCVGHNITFSISPQIGAISPGSASTNSSGQAISTYTSGIAYTTITITATDTSVSPNLSTTCYVSLLDTEGPTGTIKISNNAQYTNSREVTLDLFAQDSLSGVDKMQFSNDGDNWLPDPAADYATSYYPWILTDGDGEKTVYAKFKDVAGNWSAPSAISDTIILDTTAPTQPTIDTLTSPTNISSQTITGTKSADTTSIIVTCTTANVGEVTYPTVTTWSCHLTNLTEGNNDITVKALDAAENESPSFSATIFLDTVLPTGTIKINNDAAYTNSIHITLNLSATDAQTGIAQMKFSNDGANWSDPEPYDITKPWDLEPGDGTKTVYAQFKDAAGNWSNSVSDTIILNTSGLLLIDITSHENNDRVNTSTITVSGAVSDNTATVTVNNFPATVSNYTFTAQNIPLTQGTNIITARAVKDTETKEDTINVILDTDPPSINIYTPDANSTTRSNIVYGRVSDDTKTVTVNSTPAELLSDFRFIARPTLTEGANTITVQAQDKAGNTNSSSINMTYNTQTPKVTITSPLDNSTIDISPIKVDGTNTTDQQFILVNSQTAIIDNTTFSAEGITLDTAKTVITATGYDATDNKFSDSIVVNSPNLAHYELLKVSGDVTEDDPNRPQAGANQILKVKLEKNSLPAVNEEIQFSVTQGTGTLSQPSSFTDINGEATVTLTTDANSDITNQVECYPTNNPLVKTTFYVDTRPSAPSILTKITDDSITPVPGATIPLIVKLTDQNQNPIPDEVINFQVTQGTGTLSSPSATTTYYGEAKVNLTCPNLGLVLTQVQASSNTNPSANATFNITTSAPLTVTVQDIIDKVNYNDSKIQDIKADITVNSNADFLPPTMQLKIWQKGEKQKVEELSPNPQVKIRPPLQDSTEYVQMQREIISYEPTNNIYVIKTKQQGQTEEYPYQMDYIDYAKGVAIKTEYYSKEADDTINLYIIEDSNFIQINDVWVFQKETKTLYKNLTEISYSTTNVYSNIQINTGIPDSEFQ